MMNTVLHICNCYLRSKVHMELFTRLDKMGVEQVIYVPEKKRHPDGTNDFGGQCSEIIASKIVRPYHTYLYFKKISDVFRDLENRVDLKTIGCCFATNLFSDGGVAYKAKKKYGIPYIVAVRTTDVNFFLKVPHMWPVARRILKESSKIVYIGPSIKNKLESHIITYGLRDEISDKSLLLPNGINKFWLDNINGIRKDGGNTVLYVGRFMANKNIEILLQAVLELRKEIPDIKLCLVGGGGELEEEVKNFAVKYPDCVICMGRIDDKSELLKVYRDSNVFAMISKRETFGLVYVEALSQGLPILYTKGQGIDGFFNEKVGEAVNPTSVNQVKNALKKLLLNTDDYSILPTNTFDNFNWGNIAQRYYQIINEVLK